MGGPVDEAGAFSSQWGHGRTAEARASDPQYRRRSHAASAARLVKEYQDNVMSLWSTIIGGTVKMKLLSSTGMRAVDHRFVPPSFDGSRSTSCAGRKTARVILRAPLPTLHARSVLGPVGGGSALAGATCLLGLQTRPLSTLHRCESANITQFTASTHMQMP